MWLGGMFTTLLRWDRAPSNQERGVPALVSATPRRGKVAEVFLSRTLLMLPVNREPTAEPLRDVHRSAWVCVCVCVCVVVCVEGVCVCVCVCAWANTRC